MPTSVVNFFYVVIQQALMLGRTMGTEYPQF